MSILNVCDYLLKNSGLSFKVQNPTWIGCIFELHQFVQARPKMSNNLYCSKTRRINFFQNNRFALLSNFVRDMLTVLNKSICIGTKQNVQSIFQQFS